jgi:(p)ppGpp synthase/HD superfamily hydrolase
MLTARFDDAFRYAHRLHQSQTRKGTSIPYISHLMTVSALVVEHGGNEDQAIAALLHDAVEDQGGSETLAKIRAVFGEAVAPTSRPLARWDCRFLSPVSVGRGFLRQKVRPRR